MKIFLASKSPRRKEILKSAKIDFECCFSDCKEDFSKKYDETIIKNNSLKKASCAKIDGTKECIVLGADTMVILNSVCLVKPQNLLEAFFMLKALSSNSHSVVTAYSFIKYPERKIITEVMTSKVTFRKLSYFEIIKYILQKNPLDKAGSYGIQDFIKQEEVSNIPKTSFISKLEGSYLNVEGLDINLVKNAIEKLSV